MKKPDKSGIGELTVEARGEELLGLYSMLKERELEIEGPLLQLLNRVESVLYTRLSIDEIEELQSFKKK